LKNKNNIIKELEEQHTKDKTAYQILEDSNNEMFIQHRKSEDDLMNKINNVTDE
jgi:hypothetical protein